MVWVSLALLGCLVVLGFYVTRGEGKVGVGGSGTSGDSGGSDKP